MLFACSYICYLISWLTIVVSLFAFLSPPIYTIHLQLRAACPEHKWRDLDLLFKQLNGDETKIRMKIQEWWEEPQQPEEEAWEDVNKRTVPTKPKHSGGGGKYRGERDRDRGGRGGRSDRDGGRGGRDGRGRGGRGGRGDRKPRDNNGPPQKQDQKQQPAVAVAAQRDESNKKSPSNQPATQRVGVPKPVTNAPVLKGAWGKSLGGQPATPATPASPEKPAAQAQQPVSAAPQPPKKEPVAPVEVGVVTKNDPTPAGLSTSGGQPAAPGGNVWATKGSAHLIRAEKPKPPAPAPMAPAPAAPVVQPPTPVKSDLPEPVVEEAPTTAAIAESVSTLETGLPPAVMASPSSNAWGKDSASSVKDIPSSPEAVAIAPPIPSVVEEPVAAPKPPAAAASKPPRPAPTNVLNMGHWETGDADDSTNLDFGFGSFGTEEAAQDSTPAAPPAAVAAANASPARPPPGLSIGGMPPMPANAVLVHELEHSLENTNLNASKSEQQASVPQDKPVTNPLPPQPNAQGPGVPAAAAAPVLPGQPNYNQQYGMGMYNYNAAAAAGSGFVGVHAPAGPFLGGVGVIPQQQQLPKAGGISPQPGATPGGPPGQSLPHGGLYGHHAGVPAAGTAPDAGNATADTSANATANAGAPGGPGMPPGMPGMPPYNPALYYGQQQFLHGQHQQGMGYNYGYGAQFGGVQGGFGYQQQHMGQTGGYGAPHYGDDQHQQGPPHQGNSHGHGGSGGYQKNSGGGYRGRNNHHNNNQYQNQYNPQQHGGYGQQPYGMGYQHDQYNQQRGGYGHNMGDPYGMQQQQQQGAGGGFQDDADQNNKGRRGGGNSRNNNNNGSNNNNGLPQFQGGPISGGQQQPFGLQGQNDSAQTGTTGGAGGWSNNSNNQAGGWSGGAAASGWQQGN